MWQTVDYEGNEVRWYEESTMQRYKDTLKKIQILATKDVCIENFVKIQELILKLQENESSRGVIL